MRAADVPRLRRAGPSGYTPTMPEPRFEWNSPRAGVRYTYQDNSSWKRFEWGKGTENETKELKVPFAEALKCLLAEWHEVNLTSSCPLTVMTDLLTPSSAGPWWPTPRARSPCSGLSR